MKIVQLEKELLLLGKYTRNLSIAYGQQDEQSTIKQELEFVLKDKRVQNCQQPSYQVKGVRRMFNALFLEFPLKCVGNNL